MIAIAAGDDFGLAVAPALKTVPDVIQTFVPEALGLIQAAGLVPKFTGANPTKKNWVFSQSPLAGHIVAGGSTVTMVLHTGPLP